MTDEDHPLAPLGRASVPGIDGDVRDRLDASLRVAHAERSRSRRWFARAPRFALIAPALVVVLVVTTVVMVARDQPAVAALELRDARNVVVTLPNGDQIRDPADGLILIDGAIVEVGAGGAVTIDDVTLSGGTTVTVRDQTLVTDVVGTSTTRPAEDRGSGSGSDSDTDTDSDNGRQAPDAPTTAQAPPATTVPARDEPDIARPDIARPTTTAPVSVDAPTIDDPAADDRPGTTVPRDDEPAQTETGGTGDDAVRPEEGDDPRTGSTVPDSERVDGDDLRIALRLTAGDGRVGVAWRVEGIDDRPWTVVVIRTTDGSDPDWPLGSGVVVAESAAGELVERRADLPREITSLRYRVVVLDESAGVVGRGPVQTLSDR